MPLPIFINKRHQKYKIFAILMPGLDIQQYQNNLSPMHQSKLIPIAIIASLFVLAIAQPSQDQVDLTKIDLIPTGYGHRVYSGYLNITYGDKAFFYMFYETQSGHDSDPVVLWLNGGPRCSSMIGMVTENGPFIFKPQSTQMYNNDYAWNMNAHVLYIQSPAGVGFSQGKKQSLVYNDTTTAQDNYIALIRFFNKFPYLRGNDFYMTGEGYAGIYIPRLARQIMQNNQQETGEENKINLKGIMIGNGCTHPEECYTARFVSKFQVQYMYTHGYIDSAIYSQYISACVDSFNERSINCENNQTKIKNTFSDSKANIYNVYGVCLISPTSGSEYFDKYLSQQVQRQKREPLKYSLQCSNTVGPNKLFNSDEYRSILHLDSNQTLKWTPCSDTLNYTIESRATYFDLPEIVKYGIKIHYYSGDFDAMVPIQGTLFWLKKYRSDFGATVKKNWRTWDVDGITAGMVWELDGITFWSVLGAGHLVSADKPKQAKYMFDRFISDAPTSNPILLTK